MKEFYDDVRDRKALVPGSRHRVCGAKSRKCTLPSDNLTAAQKRKLNGPCETYAINKPCSYEAFKAMPHDIAQAWLDCVQDRFMVSPACIAKTLWPDQVNPVSFGNYLRVHGFSIKKYGRYSSKTLAAIQAWVTGDAKEEPVPIVEETDQEPLMEPVFVEEPEQKPAALVVSERISMELVGPWEAIRAELERRFAGQRVALTVNADVCCTLGGDAGG